MRYNSSFFINSQYPTIVMLHNKTSIQRCTDGIAAKHQPTMRSHMVTAGLPTWKAPLENVLLAKERKQLQLVNLRKHMGALTHTLQTNSESSSDKKCTAGKWFITNWEEKGKHFWEILLFAFLPRVEWEDQSHTSCLWIKSGLQPGCG